MAGDPAHRNIAVTGPKGQRATVVAMPNPHTPINEAETVYGIDGLTVEKISASEFRDFQGTVWTIDGA